MYLISLLSASVYCHYLPPTAGSGTPEIWRLHGTSPGVQIFTDLVAGHVSLSVAPQIYLWYDLGHQGLQPHTTQPPLHLLSTEDEQLDELQDFVGNITLESIRSTSIPSHRNRCRIPDIAITRKISFIRPQNTSQLLHLARRVTYLGFPLLAELKASGARCQDIQTSLSNATIPMSLARDQVTKQALHLFQMYPHQNSVVLVAISGFWWSYTIFLRAQAEGLPLVDAEVEDLDEANEESDLPLPDQDGIHPNLMQVSSDLDEPSIQVLQEQLYGFSLCSLEDISGTKRAHFHTVLPEDRLELCEDDWSDYLLYGTAPSNQVLSLILDRLHSIVHVHYDGKMG